MFSTQRSVLLLLALGASQVRAAPFEDFVKSLYRPWQGESVALSPDGEYLAYTVHERGELSIVVAAVGRAEKSSRILVEDDRPVPFTREKAPASLRFLGWSSPTRLVFAPTVSRSQSPFTATINLPKDATHVIDPTSVAPTPIVTAPIIAVGLDGTGPKTLAKADTFTDASAQFPRPTVIHGFKLGDRGTLLVEALGESSGMFAIDVVTGRTTQLNEEVGLGRFYYDRNGAPRLNYSTPLHETRRTFDLKIHGFGDRWTELDESRVGPVGHDFPVTLDNYFGERATPLHFESDSDLLYYASNVGRDTTALYAIDLGTRRRAAFAVEDPSVDLVGPEPVPSSGALVLDPETGKLVGIRVPGVRPSVRWLDPELAALQATFDGNFSNRVVTLVEWSGDRRRFLLRVDGGVDPGRYLVFLRPENVYVEMLRAAPWLRADRLHRSETVEFETPGGVRLSAYLTFPKKPRLTPPPLAIVFPRVVFGREYSGFDREAQALAELGFVVARINVRGSGGFGRAHRDALRAEGERAPVADALSAIDWIAQHHPIDRKRVVAIGHGLGGFLALRAAQLEPGAFRCVVALDAPISPELWWTPPVGFNFSAEVPRRYFFGDSARLTAVSKDPPALTKPVMLVVTGPPAGVINRQNASLRSDLERLGRSPEFFETESTFARNLPGAQAKLFRRMEEFFNLNLYDYGVRVGPATEKK